MQLYQKIIYQLVDKMYACDDMEEYNGFYSIIDIITDPKQVQEYVDATDNARYRCGAYFSKSHAIFAIGYQPFCEVPDPQ